MPATQKRHRRCPKCCACHEKCNASSENVTKELRLPHKFDMSWNMLEIVGMSRSATAATRDEGTRRWKTSKATPFAELTIGTAIRSSRGRLRTVAATNATSGEHSSTPTPPEWNGNPCYAFGKKTHLGRFFPEGHPPGSVHKQDLQNGGFTKFLETGAPLIMGYLVFDVRVELFERYVNTSRTRTFDFMGNLERLWLGIQKNSIVCCNKFNSNKNLTTK